MIDAHSSTNPYGGEYAQYPAGGADLRTRYLEYLKAENLAHGGGGTGFPLTPEHVLLSPGSAAAIELVFRAFLDSARGDRIGITSPAFQLYGHTARSLDVGILDFPLQGRNLDSLDIEGMVSARPAVTFLCSPNNPTGRCVPLHLIRRLLERSSGIVVVDEAYIEFAEQVSTVALVAEFPDLIVTRTFSKAWGLAGVRAGAVVADPSIIRTLGLVQLPFAFNQAAEVALRQKLADPTPMLESVAVLNANKNRLAARLAEIPIVKRVHPSDANFLFVEVVNGDDAYETLMRHRILVAHTGWALPHSLRISLGTEADCEQVLASFQRMNNETKEGGHIN